MHFDGFLGTRADGFVDALLVLFVVAPCLLWAAFRLARAGRHRAHRNLQVGLLIAVVVAVVLLELDIRFTDLTQGARASPLYGSRLLAVTFATHVTVAVATLGSWLALVLRSWGQFAKALPGGFSSAHRLWGKVTFVGVCLTSMTGFCLYSVVFVL